MKRYFISLLMVLIWAGIQFSVLCQTKSPSKKALKSKVKSIKFNQLKALMNTETDTVYVLNFWATWCKPCVHELPAFETAAQKFSSQKVKFLMVSLDFEEDKHTKLEPFIARKGLKNPIVLLDEPNYNQWIDQVDAGWGGSIPATLIFNNSKKYRHFLDKELDLTELNKLISEGI